MKTVVEKLAGSIRRNHLIIVSFLGWAVILVLLLVVLDRQFYQVEKKEFLLERNWKRFSSIEQFGLDKSARDLLATKDLEKRAEKADNLAAKFHEIVMGDSIIFRIELHSEDSLIIKEENLEKLREFNTFRNSLFFRDFSAIASLDLTNEPAREYMGSLKLYITTPIGVSDIEAITVKYRWYALLIFLVVNLVFWYVMKYLIFPVRKVIAFLDRAHTSNPVVMRLPKTLLEKEYNNLARDALINNINRKIGQIVFTTRNYHLSYICSRIPSIITDSFPVQNVCIIQMRKRSHSSDGYSLELFTEPHRADSESVEAFREEIKRILKERDIKQPISTFKDNVVYWSFKSEKRSTYCDLVLESENEGMVVAAISPALTFDRAYDDWIFDTCRQIAEQVRRGLQTLVFQRQLVTREKSEANINLSRNLGHDLTNIIATSKLDIISIRDFLDSTDTAAKSSTIRKTIFRESIEGLLKNTKMLQELVNIYRSFGYIKHPTFERVDIPNLIEEILSVFKNSLSQTIRISTQYEPHLPACMVEQRLLKLAIFNLLTNSYESIRLRQTRDEAPGNIEVSVRFDKDNDELIITVSDNGGGIKDTDGNRLPPEEIEKLFYTDYTTKSDEEGSGLGLSWVWTIVHDFHKGRIDARNLAGSGAAFSIFIQPNPIMDERLAR